jgi:hypothetical protein
MLSAALRALRDRLAAYEASGLALAPEAVAAVTRVLTGFIAAAMELEARAFGREPAPRVLRLPETLAAKGVGLGMAEEGPAEHEGDATRLNEVPPC